MSMFDTYDNMNPNYIPNNTSPSAQTSHLTKENKPPRLLKDLKGRCIGYTWGYGERFNLKLSVGTTITVFKDSIIYDVSGECPNETTEACRLGQRAYNVVDSKSWTYTGKHNESYQWDEDDELTYSPNGDKTIIVYPDMKEKYIQLNIFNFKWESIFESKSNIGDHQISIKVDEALSEILKPGVYYCILKVVGESECTINNKFTIVIN